LVAAQFVVSGVVVVKVFQLLLFLKNVLPAAPWAPPATFQGPCVCLLMMSRLLHSG
jgi:hypothetical protein